MSLKRILLLPLSLLCTFVACHDDDVSVGPTGGPVVLSETEMEVGAEGRYFVISAKPAEGVALSDVSIASSAEWISVDVDTLSETSGTVAFYVADNGEEGRRSATLTFSASGFAQPSTLAITQRSSSEDDGNAIPGGMLTRQARVGYGYNMLIDYDDPASVTSPILDYTKIVKAENSWGSIINEDGRAQQSLSIFSSYSLEEMSSNMSSQSTTKTKILFYNKTVKKYKKTSEYSYSQQSYGYSSLKKVVASRYIDEGKLTSIIRQGNDIFSDDFKELYDQVNTAPTEENVAELVTLFGTHLITYADLGGRLDYYVNFRSTETSRKSIEKYLTYKSGKKTKDEDVEEASHNLICSGDELAFDIYGGTESAMTNLKTASTTKDRYGQVSPALLGKWLNSVSTTDPTSLALISCSLIPIWDLFTNTLAQSTLISHIQSMAYAQGGDLGGRLQELSLDNYYTLPITSDMLAWNDGSPSATLVRIGSYSGIPKVEICHEYVPQLRGDRKVTMFYPIHGNQTNIRRGIFPGDGENAPSEVTFDQNGGCYVRPLDGFAAGDVIDTLFYISGSFYTSDLGIDAIKKNSVSVSIEDHYMVFGHGVQYPVVKIGPGYWTRCNIKEKMYFGEPRDETNPTGAYYFRENVLNNMLYANVLMGNSYSFQQSHPGLFDDAVDALDYRIHWYVPRLADLQALTTYVGNNCKALFAGQQSGFEAQFAGYYGKYDDLNGGSMFSDKLVKLRYEGEECFIASKEDSQKGNVYIITPDYQLKQCDTQRARDNRYPVRPYRSSHYSYK